MRFSFILCKIQGHRSFPLIIVSRWNGATHESETAGTDHDDDEGFEVFVLDQFVHVAAEGPPVSAGGRVDERVAALGLHAARGAALVRVLHKHDVHLFTG